MNTEIHLDGQTVQDGLEAVREGGDRPTLCMVAPNRLRLAVMYDAGTVVSWEQALPLDVNHNYAFIIPAAVVKMLSCGVLDEADALSLQAAGKDVRMQLRGDYAAAELRWQWNSADLGKSAELEPLLAQPQHAVEVPSGELTAVLRQGLDQPDALDIIWQNGSALIAMIQVAPTITVGGRPLNQAVHPAAYFDLKALARAIEWVAPRDGRIWVQVNGTGAAPFMVVAAKRGRGRVQCAIRANVVADAGRDYEPILDVGGEFTGIDDAADGAEPEFDIDAVDSMEDFDIEAVLSDTQPAPAWQDAAPPSEPPPPPPTLPRRPGGTRILSEEELNEPPPVFPLQSQQPTQTQRLDPSLLGLFEGDPHPFDGIVRPLESMRTKLMESQEDDE
ncbi:MAG: hypothetical protein JXB47_13555 [Anaerolineae bacterium]|nr:hypothetical protein [Anaerolineae bacterium]